MVFVILVFAIPLCAGWGWLVHKGFSDWHKADEEWFRHAREIEEAMDRYLGKARSEQPQIPGRMRHYQRMRNES